MFNIQDIILRVPNMLSGGECDALIEYHKANEDQYESEYCPDANTGENTYSSFKMITLESYTEEHDIVHRAMTSMIEKWQTHLEGFDAFHVPLLSTRLNYSHKYRLLKYDVGNKIHPHTDFSDYTYASCTFNLNDDYEGGVFSFWNGQHNIELKKGDGMIWPADYFWVHEVTPITEGSRYSTNSFIRSIDSELHDETNTTIYDELRNRTIDTTHKEYGQYFWRGVI